jgi:hypothetical protein
MPAGIEEREAPDAVTLGRLEDMLAFPGRMSALYDELRHLPGGSARKLVASGADVLRKLLEASR